MSPGETGSNGNVGVPRRAQDAGKIRAQAIALGPKPGWRDDGLHEGPPLALVFGLRYALCRMLVRGLAGTVG